MPLKFIFVWDDRGRISFFESFRKSFPINILWDIQWTSFAPISQTWKYKMVYVQTSVFLGFLLISTYVSQFSPQVNNYNLLDCIFN